MSVTNITMPASPEVIAAWQSFAPPRAKDDDGLTIAEIADQWGVTKNTLSAKVNKWVRDGLCVRGYAARTNSIGRVTIVPVYRVSTERKKNYGNTLLKPKRKKKNAS